MSEIRKRDTFYVGLFVGAALFSAVEFLPGDCHTSRKVRREAVKAGVARYVPDEDGSPKFEWITPEAKRDVRGD